MSPLAPLLRLFCFLSAAAPLGGGTIVTPADWPAKPTAHNESGKVPVGEVEIFGFSPKGSLAYRYRWERDPEDVDADPSWQGSLRVQSLATDKLSLDEPFSAKTLPERLHARGIKLDPAIKSHPWPLRRPGEEFELLPVHIGNDEGSAIYLLSRERGIKRIGAIEGSYYHMGAVPLGYVEDPAGGRIAVLVGELRRFWEMTELGWVGVHIFGADLSSRFSKEGLIYSLFTLSTRDGGFEKAAAQALQQGNEPAALALQRLEKADSLSAPLIASLSSAVPKEVLSEPLRWKALDLLLKRAPPEDFVGASLALIQKPPQHSESLLILICRAAPGLGAAAKPLLPTLLELTHKGFFHAAPAVVALDPAKTAEVAESLVRQLEKGNSNALYFLQELPGKPVDDAIAAALPRAATPYPRESLEKLLKTRQQKPAK